MSKRRPNLYNKYCNHSGGQLRRVPSGKGFLEVVAGEIPISDLRFDQENDRLFHELLQATGEDKKLVVDQEFLQKLLEETAGIYLLAESLLESGTTSEPLLVDSRGIVKEGNRRLAAFRLLASKGYTQFETIFCHIYAPGTPQKTFNREVFLIHLPGKDPWLPINQAASVARRIKNGEMSAKEAAIHQGTSVKRIEQTVLASELVTKFQKKTGKLNPKKFTHFTRWVKVESKIKSILNMSKVQARNWFFKLMEEQRVIDCQHVDKMNQLLMNAKSRYLLETKNSQVALEYVMGKTPEVTKGLHTSDPYSEFVRKTRKNLKDLADKSPFTAKTKMGKKRIRELESLRRLIDDILSNAGASPDAVIEVS